MFQKQMILFEVNQLFLFFLLLDEMFYVFYICETS